MVKPNYTVYETQSELISAVQDQYSGYNSVSVSADFNSPDIISCNNHSQSTLNYFFNSYYNTYYSFSIYDSCSEVATSTLTECMLNHGKISTKYTDMATTIDEIFHRVVKVAYEAGWDGGYSGNGTPRNMADEIMNGNFDYYTPKLYR